jgi:hypothetical protein
VNLLTAFGYTERESQFLRFAALVGGYFVRSQFNTFIARECGALAQRFIERGALLGHLRELHGLGGRKVLHIHGSAVYAALGDGQNRNRREHRHDDVRRRLFALDYVLGHQLGEWLLTGAERVTYLGWKADPTRAPRIVRINPSGEAEIVFVDDGAGSFARWVTFLKLTRSTFSSIEKAVVVFASSDKKRFEAAEIHYRRTVTGENASGNLDLDRLRTYFVSRQLLEAKKFDGFDQRRLDAYRESRQVFAGAHFEELFQQWTRSGELQGGEGRGAPVRFYELPQQYAWLSPARYHTKEGSRGCL